MRYRCRESTIGITSSLRIIYTATSEVSIRFESRFESISNRFNDENTQARCRVDRWSSGGKVLACKTEKLAFDFNSCRRCSVRRQLFQCSSHRRHQEGKRAKSRVVFRSKSLKLS